MEIKIPYKVLDKYSLVFDAGDTSNWYKLYNRRKDWKTESLSVDKDDVKRLLRLKKEGVGVDDLINRWVYIKEVATLDIATLEKLVKNNEGIDIIL